MITDRLSHFNFAPELGVEHLDVEVDGADFQRFEKEFAPYVAGRDSIYASIPGGETWPGFEPTREKLFEYYLTMKALTPRKGWVYMDVASCLSLFPNYLVEKFEAEAIRQDLFYPEGLRSCPTPRITSKSLFGRALPMQSLGCDGCSMPMDTGSVDAMALHCSFEHFEEDRDGRFVAEALRVLRPGGTLLIIPFYCGDLYQEISKPEFAVGCQFHRYYDPAQFTTRVLAAQTIPARVTVRYYHNAREIDPAFYCLYSVAFTKG